MCPWYRLTSRVSSCKSHNWADDVLSPLNFDVFDVFLHHGQGWRWQLLRPQGFSKALAWRGLKPSSLHMPTMSQGSSLFTFFNVFVSLACMLRCALYVPHTCGGHWVPWDWMVKDGCELHVCARNGTLAPCKRGKCS